MVWAAISSRGKSDLIFVKPGVKINALYYINNILEPFFSKQSAKLYPKGDLIWHHDSALSHSSKLTQDWLRSKKIKYIRPEDWTPCSPDNAPLDFYIWGFMLHLIKDKKVSSICGMKRALCNAWRKIPQKLIDKSLKSWAKRSRAIYDAKGGNIEHFIHKI